LQNHDAHNCGTGFISAVLSVGYHIGLAGRLRGHYNPTAPHAKAAEIHAQISTGVNLTLNVLYINPHQLDNSSSYYHESLPTSSSSAAQDMFQLCKINQMEREMYQYLE
jgi:hypothetical protein